MIGQFPMKIAMKDIHNQDFKSAIINIDKSLSIYPKNPSALYFKGYSQIIIGEKEKGCEALVDAIYYNSNNAKALFPEKCLDYNPKLNPENFKSGKFTLQILGEPLLYNFERKDNRQFETFEGQIYTGEIVWYNNGEYTIIPTEETETRMSENPKFLIRILKIENNTYLYERIEENQVQYGKVEKVG
ncbi:hypothetical protein J3D55_003711 [Chryseobacterium ginsenosidimutans]|uniref:tetratricopeptide repeat protein n=1 Tax=Chryseobacterium ginsenosidimutans TaxID=687846 RepID=UPI0021698B08|nr:hypothetical protein [Chryseobacterium ginsenosidimutans]MCS3870795.1 hypothetical protein [Chryseobacterium ginsenosidimutans]